MVEEWHAAFETCSHGGTVEFYQDVVWQICDAVEIHHLLDEVGNGGGAVKLRRQRQRAADDGLLPVRRQVLIQFGQVGVGPREEPLRRLATKLRVSDRVRFLGHRNDVPELLRETDVYVHCSHSDGFGIAAAEAMAAGCAVVATRNEGLDSVVGNAGILVQPGDVEALAHALRRLLASPRSGSASECLHRNGRTSSASKRRQTVTYDSMKKFCGQRALAMTSMRDVLDLPRCILTS